MFSEPCDARLLILDRARFAIASPYFALRCFIRVVLTLPKRCLSCIIASSHSSSSFPSPTVSLFWVLSTKNSNLWFKEKTCVVHYEQRNCEKPWETEFVSNIKDIVKMSCYRKEIAVTLIKFSPNRIVDQVEALRHNHGIFGLWSILSYRNLCIKMQAWLLVFYTDFVILFGCISQIFQMSTHSKWPGVITTPSEKSTTQKEQRFQITFCVS